VGEGRQQTPAVRCLCTWRSLKFMDCIWCVLQSAHASRWTLLCDKYNTHPLDSHCHGPQDNLRRVALEGLEQGNTQLLRQHASRRYTAMLERAGELED